MGISRSVLSLVAVSALVLLLFQNCSQVNFATIELESKTKKTAVTVVPVTPVCREADAFEVKPKLKWDWYAKLDKTLPENFADFSQVMATPMVADLNGDGKPEVVFTSFTWNTSLWFVPPLNKSGYVVNGVLRIVDGSTGQNLVNISSQDLAPYSASSPLLVDLDNDGKIEIVYVHYTGAKVIALNFDGTKRWEHPNLSSFTTFMGLSAADLNGDGNAEVILPREVITETSLRQPKSLMVLNGSAGSPKQFAYGLDYKQPNQIQIVGANGVFDHNGNKLFSLNPQLSYAAADVDPDVQGVEIVGSGAGLMEIYDGLSGRQLANIDLTPLNELLCPSGVGGGTPTLGDFDGDKSTIEIAVATGRYLMVFNRKGEIITKFETQDCSSRVTGISSFDFNGDGKPEILYADEEYFRIFEIHKGQLRVVQQLVNPSGTLNEFPIVVDVNGDGSSEVVVSSNNYAVAGFYKDTGEEADKILAASVTGVRAFESNVVNSWMPTRKIWNQFDYNPQMVSDRGQMSKVAAVEGSYLSRTFRRNSQLGLQELICTK